MASKTEAQEAIYTDGFAYRLRNTDKVVAHSRGRSWVTVTLTGHHFTITLTEGGKHIVAVGPSNYKKSVA